MKNKWFLTGILSILLVFGLVLTGCPTDEVVAAEGGLTWTAVTVPGLNNISGIAYGGGKFVAVGSSGAAYSTDGVSWTAVTISGFSSYSISDIAYGGDKFVAVGYNATRDKGDSDTSYRGVAMYSTDGVNWTVITISGFSGSSDSGRGTDISGIAYGGGKFVAVGYNTIRDSGDSYRDYKVAYSTDGASWTAVTVPEFNSISAIAYGGDKFVAVGSGKAAYSNNQE